MKTQQNIKFILTSRLNQDCAENLFSIIRGKGGFRDNPDLQQFKDAFKYLVADKLFVQYSYSNCKVDGDQILLDVSTVAMAGKYKKQKETTNVKKYPVTDIAMAIRAPMSLPTQNVIAYLAGYLLKKIPVDTCADCTKQLILKPGEERENIHTFLEIKAYREGFLMYPTREMVNFC